MSRQAENTERQSQPRRRDAVGDQRIASRIERRLTTRDSQATCQKERQAGRQAAHHRHDAPHGHRRRQNAHATATIDQAPGGHARNAQRQCKAEGIREAELRVGDAKVGLDRLDQQAEQVAIDEGVEVDATDA